MAEPAIEILTQYRNISNKLKKRLLRKPNVAEACEQFSKLAKDLQRQECPQYAGFCCLALARRQTLGNPAGETQALVHGARLFLDAEKQNRDLNCPSFEDHLNAAINCYSHAVRIHMEQKHYGLAASLCLELGDLIKNFGKSLEAIPHYQRAADLQNQSPLDYLNALDLVAICKVEIGDYDSALNLYTEMMMIVEEKGVGPLGKPGGAFQDILAKCEIMRVLLLLLLQPNPQKLRTEHAQLLEKYAWETTESETAVNYLSEDCFLLFQSLVMACQSHELEVLKCLQVDLWPLLSVEQNDLLEKVVRQINKKSA
uniref:Uncharacterized protein n=1 Tax=Strigamia maritima TaxID=126957 RepID=T1JBR8_STRMM